VIDPSTPHTLRYNITDPTPTGLLAESIEQLRQAGITAPEQEARALAGHVAANVAEPDQDAALQALVQRRCRREPLEHLLGKVRFRSLDLLVGPGVFVPQPETSSVVQWAVDRLQELIAAGTHNPLCVDLCTGSGTIALSLAAEVRAASVHAVELDPGALAWTERNAKHHSLAVTLHQGDVAHALPGFDGKFDLVASNPPYVATNEMGQVKPEVRDHDPAIALGAGTDGLDIIRAVESAARRLLKPGGLLIVEHSDRQGSSAPAVFSDPAHWTQVQDHVDHDGLDRFVTAVRT
jgi:release factor glutamine methyltransferase